MDDNELVTKMQKELTEAWLVGRYVFNLDHLPNINTVTDLIAFARYLKESREEK